MSLKYLVQKSGSGIAHPFYSVSPRSRISTSPQNMYVRITCHPPLDGVTQIDSTSEYIHFHVLVESETDYGDLEIQIWTDGAGSSEWTAVALAPNPEKQIHSTSRTGGYSDRPSQIRKWYSTSIANQVHSKPASFTIRFRLPGETGWRWVRDQDGTGDGLLIPSARIIENKDEHLWQFFEGIDSQFDVSKTPSDTPHTTLWSLKARAAPAKDDKSGYSVHSLGSPTELLRWFALVRLWSPWLAPRQGRHPPFAEKDAILYCFLRNDGRHVAALAISGVADVLSVFQSKNDQLVVNSRNDREEEGPIEVAISVGASFQEAISAVVYHARKVVSTMNPVETELIALTDQRQSSDKDAHATWLEDWYDGLTYCTWNGLGQNLTQKAILGAIESLKKEDIAVTNLIIDDNWQSLDNEGQTQFKRGWTDFEANPKAFPNGLHGLTTAIRSAFPNVRHIAVWHALLGYWGGISPDGTIAKTYKTRKVLKRDSVVGGSMTVVDAPDIKRMYDDFYQFLQRAGVDSAKTDAQFFLDEIESASARRELTSTYISTWMIAQLRHLSGKAISCMSQIPQILFQSQLPNDSRPIPVRNSDDFFPDIEESHAWHIFCNSHNAILAQHLNVLPDWDMFQTNHKWAGFHAAARCISGGPICITDAPGKHDVDLIHQMTGNTVRGNTVILRPSVVGRSVEAYVGYEEEKLHKITAYNGDTDTGSSFLAIFNLRDFSITEVIHKSAFLGISSARRYLLKQHRPEKPNKLEGLSVITDSEDHTSIFDITLEAHSWNISTAIPVRGPYNVSEKLRDIEIANLGLLHKMTGAAAILQTEIDILDPLQLSAADHEALNQFSASKTASSFSKMRITTRLKALGVYGLWISNLKDFDWQNRILVMIDGAALPLEFAKVEALVTPVLVLDVESAWKKLELDSYWDNEVTLRIFIH